MFCRNGARAVFLLMVFPCLAPAEDGVANLDSGRLVRLLGDSSFRTREKVMTELLRRGEAALPEVERGARDEDLEIRLRSRKILDTLQTWQRNAELKGFLTGKEDPAVSLPGWMVLRGLLGDDAVGRSLYAGLYRTRRNVLQSLERDRNALAGDFQARASKATDKGILRADISVEEIAELLLAAILRPSPLDVHQASVLIGLLNSSQSRDFASWNDGIRRLVEKWIDQTLDDARLGPQMIWLANGYTSADFRKKRLEPATVKLVEAAVLNLRDINLFYRAINQARNLGMSALIDTKLRPAMTKALHEAVKGSGDLNQLSQLINQAQNTGITQIELREIVRPFLEKAAHQQATRLEDKANFYPLINAVRSCGCEDVLEEKLKPAFRLELFKVSASGDPDRLMQTYYLACNLGATEDVELILKPPASALARTLLSRVDDTPSLQKGLMLAQNFRFGETLVPAAEHLVENMSRANPNLERVELALQLFRTAGVPDPQSQAKLKPAAVLALAEFARKPEENPGRASVALRLADQLELKEGLPLAEKIATTKTQPAYIRFQALMHIAKVGGRDNLPTVETLIGEGGDLGSTNFNNKNIAARLGDVALGVAVMLAKENHAAIGFPWPTLTGQAIVNTHQGPIVFGFENDTTRTAAQKKWRDLRAKAK